MIYGLLNFPMECPKTRTSYLNTAKIFYVQLGLGGYISVQRRQRRRKLMSKQFLVKSQRKRMTIRKTGALLPKLGSKYLGIWKGLMWNTWPNGGKV
jgi:hypothetical protein